MKKLLLSVLALTVVAFGLVSNADAKPSKSSFAKKGKFAIGMDTSIGGMGSGLGWQTRTMTYEVNGQEGEDVDTSSLVLNPTVDYFVINGLAVGARPVFAMTSQEDAEAMTMGLAIRAHYYYPVMGSVFLFGGGEFGFGKNTNESDNAAGGTDEVETGLKWFDINAGAALAFGGKFGGFGSLALGYNYIMGNPDGPVEYTDSGFGIKAGIGIYF